MPSHTAESAINLRDWRHLVFYQNVRSVGVSDCPPFHIELESAMLSLIVGITWDLSPASYTVESQIMEV